MPVVHKLILGGGQYLPFALAREAALRRTGAEVATQRYKVGGADITVKVIGSASYVTIIDESWVAVPVQVDLTLSRVFDVPVLTVPTVAPIPRPEPPGPINFGESPPPPASGVSTSMMFGLDEQPSVEYVVGLQEHDPDTAIQLNVLPTSTGGCSASPPPWGRADIIDPVLDQATGQHIGYYSSGVMRYVETVVYDLTRVSDDGKVAFYDYSKACNSQELHPKSVAFRAAVQADEAAQLAYGAAESRRIELIWEAYFAAQAAYEAALEKWADDTQKKLDQVCTLHQGRKLESRMAHRAEQLSILSNGLKRGMESMFVRASVLGALDYIPLRQITTDFPITRTSSSAQTSSQVRTGSVEYTLTSVVDDQVKQRTVLGTWSAAPDATDTDLMTFTFESVWGDDIRTLIEGAYPGMVAVSPEFHRGGFVSGGATYRSMGGGIVGVLGQDTLTVSTPDEYREYLEQPTGAGVEAIRDDQVLASGLSVDVQVLEYEAFDAFTGQWVWTSSVELLSTDPALGNDELLCLAYFDLPEQPDFSVRAIRRAGSVKSTYSVVDGRGSWASDEFLPAEGDAPVTVAWGARPPSDGGGVPVRTLVPGIVAIFAPGGVVSPKDVDSQDAYPAKTAKRLTPATSSPGNEIAAEWALTKALEWAQYIKPPPE